MYTAHYRKYLALFSAPGWSDQLPCKRCREDSRVYSKYLHLTCDGSICYKVEIFLRDTVEHNSTVTCCCSFLHPVSEVMLSVHQLICIDSCYRIFALLAEDSCNI